MRGEAIANRAIERADDLYERAPRIVKLALVIPAMIFWVGLQVGLERGQRRYDRALRRQLDRLENE